MFFKAGEVSAVWVTGFEITKTFNLLIWDSYQNLFAMSKILVAGVM